jgi:phosphoribosylformylglycinamidine cyclo-ligase
VTETLAAARIVPHYCANITGHGWRKLMRHTGGWTYRIHTLPPVPPVLAFIAEKAGLPPRESYGSLNMGAGFALFVAPGEAKRCVEIARACGINAWDAGVVNAGERQVAIEPLQLTFAADELHVRA